MAVIELVDFNLGQDLSQEDGETNEEETREENRGAKKASTAQKAKTAQKSQGSQRIGCGRTRQEFGRGSVEVGRIPLFIRI